MTKKRQPPERQKKVQRETPPEEKVFPTDGGEEPASNDIFSSLADYATVPETPEPEEEQEIAPTIRSAEPRLKRLSRIQKLLLAGIVVIGAALLFTSLRHPKPSTGLRRSEARRQVRAEASENRPAAPAPASSGEPVATEVAEPNPEESQRASARLGSLPSPEPLSLQLADRLYQRRDFEHALVTYDKLSQRLPNTEENQPLQDLLLLRMAMCHKNSGNVPQADTMLRTVSLSRLPILRALARYHQSMNLMDRKRYLEAATRAYQTLGLIEVLEYDKKWVSAVQQQCCFLVAEAMTRHILALCDADADVPPELWGRHPDIEPFIDMDEAQLRVLLASGCDKLNQASLSPQIRAASGAGTTPRWSVICDGAPIEELLARFATRAGLNAGWSDNGQALPNAAETAAVEDNLRRRPVCLYLPSASAREVITTAAGSVGLLARADEKGNIQVLDPASYSSLAEHTKLLAAESVSLWRRFLLACDDDPRAANGHFAVGLLQTASGRFDEGLAEYKLVANRFPKHALAPYALLLSGKLKVRLRDYVGAHEDLKQLVELYSETDLSDRACLYLADATMRAGLQEEATGLYQKVYNLGLSVESQMQSALGAGRCYYERKDYEEAARWLNRYVTLVREPTSASPAEAGRPEFYTACLLLGKSYLALHNPQQAHAALNLALKGELPRAQHLETITVLAKTYIEQESFLPALQILEEAGGWQLSQQETVELLLLRAQVLRAIGLPNKAVVLLAEKSQYLPSPELKGRLAIELGRAHAEAGGLEAAQKTLSEAFALVEAGPLAQQIGAELARTCLRLGQADQAAAVCAQLLGHADGNAREPILALLAEVYRRQGKYDQAVAALLKEQTPATNPGAAPTPADSRALR
jgi:tetratricopeptide (TPR) repeat protein